MKDFYFSEKHKKHIESIPDFLLHSGFRVSCFFNGKEYTECIDAGKIPLTSNQYDDLVFIGTGTYDNVSTKTN